jgi:hypothetical protein
MMSSEGAPRANEIDWATTGEDYEVSRRDVEDAYGLVGLTATAGRRIAGTSDGRGIPGPRSPRGQLGVGPRTADTTSGSDGVIALDAGPAVLTPGATGTTHGVTEQLST